MSEMSTYSQAARILALKMTGQVGPRMFKHLLLAYGTVDNILDADQSDLLELDGIGTVRAEAIAGAPDNLEKAGAAIDALEAEGARAVTCFDENYPESLLNLNDPPPLFYYRGHLPERDCKRVAIIGSQDVTPDGIANAMEIANRLAGKGLVVISGLARGIDTAGLTGALQAGGTTFAILPSGFNHIHPPENAGLAEEIVQKGGLISE